MTTENFSDKQKLQKPVWIPLVGEKINGLSPKHKEELLQKEQELQKRLMDNSTDY